jgi:hypothetical protein
MTTHLFRPTRVKNQEINWIKLRIENWQFFEFEYDTIEERLIADITNDRKTLTEHTLDSIKQLAIKLGKLEEWGFS